MRVVLDTNVLARPAYSSTGPATRLLERLEEPDNVLVVSEFILAELDRVLRYPRLQKLHGFDDAAITRYVLDVEAAALVVEIDAGNVPKVSADPDDDPVIATAVAGGVDVLCTLDKHLRTTTVVDFCRQEGIRVLTDVELLQELQGASGAAP